MLYCTAITSEPSTTTSGSELGSSFGGMPISTWKPATCLQEVLHSRVRRTGSIRNLEGISLSTILQLLIVNQLSLPFVVGDVTHGEDRSLVGCYQCPHGGI